MGDFVPTVEVSKGNVTAKINASDLPEWEKKGWKKAGAKPSKPKTEDKPKPKKKAAKKGK